MRILFITYNLDVNSNSGGSVVSSRNYYSLAHCIQTDLIINYTVHRKEPINNHLGFLKIIKDFVIDVSNISFGGLDKSQKKEILNIISQNNINIIFLDSSLFGNLAKSIKIRYNYVKVITYFHNHEYYFIKQSIRINRFYHLYYRLLFAYLNEKYACIYSDFLISINIRDKESIEKMYRTEVNEIIPVSMEDKLTHLPQRTNEDKSIIGLFVGSSFFANIQGIDWFIDKVLPFVNMKLVIVGKGMSKLKSKSKYNNDNIVIFDNIENIESIYNQADFVIIPIFYGSGMKVKTAEALMFGKYIFGTNEAFIGYNIESEVGTSCNTALDFIKSIKSFKPITNKFNHTSRQMFLENYSFKSTFDKFSKIVSLYNDN